MKFMIVLAVFVAAAAAAPTDTDRTSVIIVQEDVPNTGDGNFGNRYQTSNGITSETQGKYFETPEGGSVAQQGRYAYTAPGGEPIELTWTADQDGFRVSGSHVPK